MRLLFSVFAAFFFISPEIHAADNEQESHEEIKIGFVYGLTGPAQAWAEYGRLGAELAIKEINQSGGINGQQIKAIFEDSRTNPASAVSAYKKLVEIDKVKVVVGDVWDFITNPIIPLSKKDKVVQISPTVVYESVNPNLEKLGGSEYFFTMGHRISLLEDSVRKFFEVNPNVKSAAILCWDDHWGYSYLSVWKKIISERGIKIIDESCTIDFSHDYKADIARIASKKHDLVLFGHLSNVVLRRIREHKLNSLILTSSNIVENLENGSLPKELAEGVYYSDWKPNEEFVAKFQKAYGKYPIIDASSHYDTVYAIAKALTLDPDLKTGMKKLKFEGSHGEINFTESYAGDFAKGTLYQIKKGTRVAVP